MEKQEILRLTDKMRTLCSRREYCRSDIVRKILSHDLADQSVADEIVTVLIKERYIDDMRYAAAFARDKASIAGWGAVKIRYALSMKGIDREVIAAALEEIDDAKADERMTKLLEVKVRSLKDDPDRRIKLLRFGMGRGYGYDELSGCIEKLLKNE